MKRAICLLCFCLTLIILSGCAPRSKKNQDTVQPTAAAATPNEQTQALDLPSGENKLSEIEQKTVEKAQEQAQIITDAFTATDMVEINESIFGADVQSTEIERTEAPDGISDAQPSILESVFGHVSMKVKETTTSTITYEVVAPNMENVFMDLSASETDISEEVMLQFISDYADHAETKVFTVTVDYIVDSEEIIANYQDESFINAITGGLLGAYKQLYSEILDQYRGEVN